MITILLEKIKALLIELKYNIEHWDPSEQYSTEEKEIGHWLNDEKLYRKTFYSDTRVGYKKNTELVLNDVIPDNINIVSTECIYNVSYEYGGKIYDIYLDRWPYFGYYIELTDKKVLARQDFTESDDAGLLKKHTILTIYYTKTED